MIDLNMIGRGVLYKELRKSFVIFICTFDLFGRGRRVYTFEKMCREEPDLGLGDGAEVVFLNASPDWRKGTAAKNLEFFLRYVSGDEADDPFTKTLDEAVRTVKSSEKWRAEYMTLQLSYLEHEDKARKEGILTSLRNLMANEQVSAERAMQMLGVAETERPWFKSMLHQVCARG